ncbi:MAG: hypothetical protein IJ565_00330 [Bacilli bacterium]|nr:hypothetical protein [Bacilli bacterium]
MKITESELVNSRDIVLLTILGGYGINTVEDVMAKEEMPTTATTEFGKQYKGMRDMFIYKYANEVPADLYWYFNDVEFFNKYNQKHATFSKINEVANNEVLTVEESLVPLFYRLGFNAVETNKLARIANEFFDYTIKDLSLLDILNLLMGRVDEWLVDKDDFALYNKLETLISIGSQVKEQPKTK